MTTDVSSLVDLSAAAHALLFKVGWINDMRCVCSTCARRCGEGPAAAIVAQSARKSPPMTTPMFPRFLRRGAQAGHVEEKAGLTADVAGLTARCARSADVAGVAARCQLVNAGARVVLGPMRVGLSMGSVSRGKSPKMRLECLGDLESA